MIHLRRFLPSVALVVLSIAVISPITSAAVIADHTVIVDFDAIPEAVIQGVTASYLGYYAHTSHGSQIMTGLTMLETEDPLYAPPLIYEVGDDLGHSGDTSWVPACRTYLDSHLATNLVMFSWCGGCSDNTEAGINIYLSKMDELEGDYPDRVFIYMTGHLDGTGVDGNLYARNNQIRDYCLANDKVLFDFADIESYDPDGNYYPDGGDACEWCYDWCALYSCPSCASCAHSHCFNCYQKGKAWWWMMAQLMGVDTCYCTTDCNNDGLTLSMADLVYLEAFVAGTVPAPDPLWQGDLTGDGFIDQLDVDLYEDYFAIGLSVFPEFPIPTVCDPDTTRGACCDADGECNRLAPYNCDAVDGSYQGDFASCDPNPCPQPPTGACCDSVLSCYQTTQADCQNSGNDYMGDDSVCDPSPCVASCCGIVGDINHNTIGPDIEDLVHLVTYMFQEGPPPVCWEESDINNDGVGPDVADLVDLVLYMFQDGPPPVPCD